MLGTVNTFSGGGGGGFAWSSSTGGSSGGNVHPGIMGGSVGIEEAAFVGWSGADVEGDWNDDDDDRGNMAGGADDDDAGFLRRGTMLMLRDEDDDGADDDACCCARCAAAARACDARPRGEGEVHCGGGDASRPSVGAVMPQPHLQPQRRWRTLVDDWDAGPAAGKDGMPAVPPGEERRRWRTRRRWFESWETTSHGPGWKSGWREKHRLSRWRRRRCASSREGKTGRTFGHQCWSSSSPALGLADAVWRTT